jgi:hypothetical protein
MPNVQPQALALSNLLFILFFLFFQPFLISSALGNITYHNYEGLAVNEAEKITLKEDIGQESKVVG